MNKLYYGNGSCEIQGTSNIRGVQIRYRGAIRITKTCGDNFHIIAQGDGIMIFPLGEGFLTELFEYIGEFKIISILVADSNFERVPTTIKRVMDYSELMDTNVEDLTTNSEQLGAGYRYKGKVSTTTVIDNIIKNQHTSSHNGDLYTTDGNLYEGYFHIHNSGKAMTGAEHDDTSQDLFIKLIKSGNIVPTGTATKTKTKASGRTSAGGMGGGSTGGGGGY